MMTTRQRNAIQMAFCWRNSGDQLLCVYIAFVFSSQLLGLGILIVGIIMKVDTSVFDDDEVIAALNDVSLGGNLKLGDLAKGLSTFLIVLGVFIFILAALGLFGACCKNKILLIVVSI